MAPSNNIEQFRSVLRKSRNIVAIAGAGLSAASGQITFKTLLSVVHLQIRHGGAKGMQEVFGGRMMP